MWLIHDCVELYEKNCFFLAMGTILFSKSRGFNGPVKGESTIGWLQPNTSEYEAHDLMWHREKPWDTFSKCKVFIIVRSEPFVAVASGVGQFDITGCVMFGFAPALERSPSICVREPALKTINTITLEDSNGHLYLLLYISWNMSTT